MLKLMDKHIFKLGIDGAGEKLNNVYPGEHIYKWAVVVAQLAVGNTKFYTGQIHCYFELGMIIQRNLSTP